MGNKALDKIDTKDDNSGKEKKKSTIEHPYSIADDFIPEQDNIAEKGYLDGLQTVLFSQAAQVYRPYFKHLEDETIGMLKNFIRDVERRQISKEGKSREQITNIFSSMFSSYKMEETEESKSGGMVQKMLDAERGED